MAGDCLEPRTGRRPRGGLLLRRSGHDAAYQAGSPATAGHGKHRGVQRLFCHLGPAPSRQTAGRAGKCVSGPNILQRLQLAQGHAMLFENLLRVPTSGTASQRLT